MIVAGFGFRSSASAASLEDAFLKAAGTIAVDGLATADDKARGCVFQELSERLSISIVPVEAITLTAQTTQTQSSASHKARNTGSVAEAAALAAAGQDAILIVPRVKSSDGQATCALAKKEPS